MGAGAKAHQEFYGWITRWRNARTAAWATASLGGDIGESAVACR
jgi:hypothetical protein